MSSPERAIFFSVVLFQTLSPVIVVATRGGIGIEMIFDSLSAIFVFSVDHHYDIIRGKFPRDHFFF